MLQILPRNLRKNIQSSQQVQHVQALAFHNKLRINEYNEYKACLAVWKLKPVISN